MHVKFKFKSNSLDSITMFDSEVFLCVLVDYIDDLFNFFFP